MAIIAYGTSDELPREVDGVRIVARPLSGGRRRLVGKVIEAFRIWQALWRSPSRTVVYRCASLELGLIALYTRASGRRLVFSTANIVDFNLKVLTSKRRDLLLYRLGVHLTDVIVVQTEEQIRLCQAAFRRRPLLIHSLSEVCEPQTTTPEAFVWVGRLVSYKRPLEYVSLASALPDAKFWMVAVPALPQQEDHALTEAVFSGGREIPNLELLPPRRQDEVERLLARGVASVNTADFEGMPNVLLEAWSQGVPALVLFHDPGGVVSTFGLGGFAQGSQERLKELARELWDTRHDRAALSDRCRNYVAAHHDPDVITDQWMAALSIVAPPATAKNSPSQVEFTCAG